MRAKGNTMPSPTSSSRGNTSDSSGSVSPNLPTSATLLSTNKYCGFRKGLGSDSKGTSQESPRDQEAQRLAREQIRCRQRASDGSRHSRKGAESADPKSPREERGAAGRASSSDASTSSSGFLGFVGYGFSWDCPSDAPEGVRRDGVRRDADDAGGSRPGGA